jgi:hypothetical protein
MLWYHKYLTMEGGIKKIGIGLSSWGFDTLQNSDGKKRNGKNYLLTPIIWEVLANLGLKATTITKRSGPLAPGAAFVTGGARGLGNAIAVAFAGEGARGVVIVDINQETLNEGKKVVEPCRTPVILFPTIYFSSLLGFCWRSTSVLQSKQTSQKKKTSNEQSQQLWTNLGGLTMLRTSPALSPFRHFNNLSGISRESSAP